MLVPPFDDPLAVRGLDAFSHLWLTFVFHQSPERWTPLVRPPRLGGNARVGVFASRSTHRPNRLGLSLVELVDIDTARGVRLHLRGADLVSGTPAARMACITHRTPLRSLPARSAAMLRRMPVACIA